MAARLFASLFRTGTVLRSSSVFLSENTIGQKDESKKESAGEYQPRLNPWSFAQSVLHTPVCSSKTSNITKEALKQFHTSSSYSIPSDWTDRTFEIRNDYPTSQPPESELPPDCSVSAGVSHENVTKLDAPWLAIDFKSEPERYAEDVKEYLLEGNIESDWVVQNNKVNDPYASSIKSRLMRPCIS